ncbi:multidrug transporter [Leptobacterium sp. I13]|uniref:multidrug transporter n=1 Tax=Leptobacterium meishanense TaxID=3128904 RepID=UPI0030EF8B64
MMKTNKLFLGVLIAITLVFQACTQNDDSIGDIIIEGDTINNNAPDTGGNNGNDRVELIGDITTDMTLDADITYELRGGVFINDGVTLTIPAGTRIEAGSENGVFSFLAIRQGGTIDAQGTANNPIVFTSNQSTPNPGDWGGLVIAGRAPINRGTTATAEVAGLTYGGSDANDNSGTLRYVRLEYTGGKINAESEFNGLSLYGVGDATTIEFVQVFQGLDDGFEFFGGTVNAKYLVSTGAQDDSFDWTDGWVGNGQFWIAQQSSVDGDKGIEADNLSSDPDAAPFSNPTISNVTLIGADDGDGENKGIEFRAGTKVTAYNVIIQGFPGKGIEVDDDQTLINHNNGEVSVSFSIINNVSSFDLDHGGTATIDLNDFATFYNYTLDGSGVPFNTAGTDIPAGFSVSGFRGTYQYTNATDGVNNFDPATLGGFFTSAPYAGALTDTDTWTDGWVRL